MYVHYRFKEYNFPGKKVKKHLTISCFFGIIGIKTEVTRQMSIQIKYKEIYQELFREINSGTLAAGERIPTELQLAGRFGVTRQTVLKALDVLKHDGMLKSVRGKGTYVTGMRGKSPSPRKQNNKQLAYLCSNLQDSLGHRILVGAEQAACQAGYSLIACNTRNDSACEAEYLHRMRENRISGIILLPYLQSNRELVRETAREIPLICVDNGYQDLDLPVVNTNNFQAMYNAVNYLIELGHTRIGYILNSGGLLEYIPSARERFQGYRQALEDHGLRFSPEWVAELGSSLSHRRPGDVGLDLYGYPAMNRLIRLPEPPTAVVLQWDEIAPGAICAVHDAHKRVPEDFSLIGFNDDELCTLMTPQLTSVRQPAEEIGEQAVIHLLKMIHGDGSPRGKIQLPSKLIKRSSTGRVRPDNN